MRYLPLAVLSLLGAATADVVYDAKRPCGFKIAPCPVGQVCKKVDPLCDRGENCLGYCVPAPVTLVTKTTASPPKPTYQSCGGFRIEPVQCPKGEICIDDPYSGGCGMACDMPGICVRPVFCGGIAGFVCKDGKKCVDDPRDDCDPYNGGADCAGICV
ncbi:hypothetical protein N658DRAFT_500258 [Parathielavia hyrcaniae]|uniref:Uncharacterized protein n=1 Tax=Parathielavia hyrcaniae TaxID=113614 RepID=A0AAN6PUZ1_9PEZI|nr:hypothetical protein N658DRAFT_500258 [Parathielavia hyrcaniae]